MFREVLAVAAFWAVAFGSANAAGPAATDIDGGSAGTTVELSSVIPSAQTDAKTVLVVGGNATVPTAFINAITALGHTCTFFNGNAGTPTVDYLNGFGAVITYSVSPYNNPTQLGNNLADYVDAGGRVIISTFAFCSGWPLAGRITTQASYQTLNIDGGNQNTTLTTNWLDPAHPITAGITNITSSNRSTSTLNSNATLLGTWSGGVPFCALSQNGEVVAVNLYPPGTLSGPYAQLYHQAIEWSPAFDDVGVSHLLAPEAIADLGDAVTPACSVYNYGTTTVSYDVRMKIGDSYDETAPVAAHAPGTRVYVEFPTWNVEEPLGNVAVSCSTELTDDADDSNDKQSGTTFVRKLDAGVLSLTSPSGMYTPGQSVNPEATWRNHGNTTVDFEAWVILNDPTDAEQYREKVDLSGIAPGGNIQVSSFPGYTVNTPGIWTVRCSTGLAGDVNPDNDVLDDEFIVGSPDMRALAIVAPVGQVETSAVVVPSATVKNEGTVNLPFRVWFIMNSPGDAEEYREYLDIAGIAPGGEQTYPFPEKNVGTTEGQWTTRCSVYVASDQNTANDFIDGNFTVAVPPPWESGWHEAASVPAGDGKALKDGAWLAVGEDATDAKKVIFAAKGNKSAEFYRYDPTEGESGTWLGLAAIPADEGGKNKLPSKGCVGTFGDGSVYMTKGNNTLGFWRYDVGQDSWYKLTDVPAGAGKNIKGGNDLVYVKRQHEDGYVYLLKGGDTEFYRYNTETGIWETLISAPYGGGRAKYNKGSFLVYRRKGQSVQDIYVHQAAYNDGQHHYMFRYDALGDSWADGMLKGIPVYGLEGGKTKKKKSKDGAAGVWYDDAIYALKGGNTQGFFKYYPEGDSWTQEPDTVPMLGTTLKKKRVKGGGDLVLFDDAFFAFKGNKTYEFWRYVEPTTPMMATRPGRDGVAAGVIGNGEWRMGIEPNPIASGFATLRYSLPRPGTATVTVFDIAGRSVFSTRSPGHLTTGSLPLDLRKLSAGVYLVRLDADSFTQTQKLVVQK